MIREVFTKNIGVKQLVQKLKNNFKGFDQNRWPTSAEVFPEKKYRFGFEKEQKHKTKQNRKWYEAPVSSNTRKRFQTADFR